MEAYGWVWFKGDEGDSILGLPLDEYDIHNIVFRKSPGEHARLLLDRSGYSAVTDLQTQSSITVWRRDGRPNLRSIMKMCPKDEDKIEVMPWHAPLDQ